MSGAFVGQIVPVCVCATVHRVGELHVCMKHQDVASALGLTTGVYEWSLKYFGDVCPLCEPKPKESQS